MNCSITGCDHPKRSKNQPLCDMHYCRVRRTGKVGSAASRVLLHGAECNIDGCTKPMDSSKGWCNMHATRARRHGDPLTRLPANSTPQDAHPQWKGQGVGYGGAHMRVRATRGAATQHPCVDCHQQAEQWSYRHTDPNERASELGPYSPDPSYYDARCVSCHKHFDLSRLSSARRT